MSKAKKKSREDIMDSFMTYVVDHGFDIELSSFCKAHKINKKQFNGEFESIDEVERQVWAELMKAAIVTTTGDSQLDSFSMREKLLTLYYTFFENCALNSSFLKASISHHGRTGMLKVLKPLKEEFVAVINSFQSISIPFGRQYEESINRLANSAVGESFYAQLLFLLDFWFNDDSAEYEKTDIAIEKTVRASMDMLDVTPVKSVIDFAKFFWTERLQKGL